MGHSLSADCIGDNRTLWRGAQSAVLSPPFVLTTHTLVVSKPACMTNYTSICHLVSKKQWQLIIFQLINTVFACEEMHFFVIKQACIFSYLIAELGFVSFYKIIYLLKMFTARNIQKISIGKKKIIIKKNLNDLLMASLLSSL